MNGPIIGKGELVEAVGKEFATELAKRLNILHNLIHAFQSYPLEDDGATELLESLLEDLEGTDCNAANVMVVFVRQILEGAGWTGQKRQLN